MNRRGGDSEGMSRRAFMEPPAVPWRGSSPNSNLDKGAVKG